METITFWGVITAILSAIVAALEMITLGACLCLGSSPSSDQKCSQYNQWTNCLNYDTAVSTKWLLLQEEPLSIRKRHTMYPIRRR